MKPIVTWVVLANAEQARVVQNRGPAKGFEGLKDMTWTADSAVEYSSQPGHGNNPSLHGQTKPARRDPKEIAEAAFAETIAERLAGYKAKGLFDRLILVASPHMLGTLRPVLTSDVAETVLAEIAKDLTHATVEQLREHLQDVIAA